MPNAHLIAASPDLLAVCETFIKSYEQNCISDSDVARARAAIISAEQENHERRTTCTAET